MPIQLHTSIPGPKSQALMKRRLDSVARGPFHTTPIFAAKAYGPWIEDVDGNKLLDFASGIGVTTLGHVNPRVTEAILHQAKLFQHASFNVMPYEGYIALAEKLNSKTPGDFKKKTFLANSGAEAVENAVKIARVFTGRTPILCFEHAFHGRTYMAMNLTYKEKPYKAGFGPFENDVYRAPFPYTYRDFSVEDCIQKFSQVIKTMPQKPAAIIIEPILGEGGFVPAPKEFLGHLRRYCTAENVVFIADEIQSGFGRTGTLYACEQLDLVPDLILSAKGLGNGMPISAVTGRAEIMDGPTEGGIGGTFGGNPVSCAAALAVFESLEKDRVFEKSQELTISLDARLNQFKEKYPFIGDVRGLGPMKAMEFVKDRKTKEAFPEAAKELIRFCYRLGLVIMTSGSYGNVVRLLMPLTLSSQELEEGLDIIEEGLKVMK